MVVGGSGSGKTYSEIKPSLMQLHSSYVITDPKGTILPETGYLFTNNGYTVRSFNTIDFSKSLHYNPLAYMQLTFDGGERTMQFYFTTTNPVKMITDDQTDPTYLKSLV